LSPAHPVRNVRTIALLVPVTSRGRTLRNVADTDLLRMLIPSVLDTATWTPRLAYRIYVGYDAGDPFYDRVDRRRSLGREFRRLAGRRPADLVLHRSVGTAHAPCAVWNALFRRAYDDGCDFFYQVGDDVELETREWACDFPAALLLNPVCPGLGVTGPLDTNAPDFPVLTQAFVSRVHMSIFGTFYPPAFRNWFSDNWLTDVYAPSHVRRLGTHRARNSGGAERYAIDEAALDLLNREVPRGRRRLAAWLAWSGRTPARSKR
jgi:hypothetical protein